MWSKIRGSWGGLWKKGGEGGDILFVVGSGLSTFFFPWECRFVCCREVRSAVSGVAVEPDTYLYVRE